MFAVESFMITCLVFTTVASPSAKKLSEFVSNFEELRYDTQKLHARHTRAIKVQGEEFSLKFNALDRNFHLRLRRDAPIFTEGFTVDSAEGVHQHVPYYICTGYIDGQHYYSSVHGSIFNGRFQGQISTNGSVYYIEPSDRYFDPNDVDFHSVIYMDKHVKEVNGDKCGLNKDIYERMKVQQYNGEDQQNVEEPNERVKRQSGSRKTCALHIQADHTYYNKYRSTQAVVAAISEHVTSANSIFLQTGFGANSGVNLAVSKITIYSTANQPGNLFSQEYIGVEQFLDLASSKNFNQFCLSYTFTNRDFSNGVLGLAWIASPNRATSGGICDRFKSSKSLNSGIVTENNYGANVPPRITSLTLTHELGHSFGSPHDARSDCLPGMPDGNYLMYAYSSNADQPNNDRFSPCSAANISLVLNSVFGGNSKPNCFKTMAQVALCGNKIVETNEQCDCGYTEECDQCCIPQNDNHNNPNACQLRSNSLCSPSQGPCCSDSCNFLQQGSQCQLASECHSASFCMANRANCPRPTNKADGIKCNSGSMVCNGGTCSGSICYSYNLEPCLCQASTTSTAEDAELCQVCCQNKGKPATCVSASKINIFDDNNDIIYMPVGSACNNEAGSFRGYCDAFHLCRDVDEDGPLASIIKRIFFSDEDSVIDAVSTWLVEKWYVVLICVVVIIALMVLTVYLCVYIIPTDNPHKREKEMNKKNSGQAVKLQDRRYRGSQNPGQDPVQPETRATRF